MKPFKNLKSDWLYRLFASAQFHSRVGPDPVSAGAYNLQSISALRHRVWLARLGIPRVSLIVGDLMQSRDLMRESFDLLTPARGYG